jgi:hypothetical protein
MPKIMQAIPVGGLEAIDLVLEYQPMCDYFLLDTDLSGFIGIGATGTTHDWNISAQIVRQANIPSILAGGLRPENVAEAIRVVKPWCVDSFTHTNIPGTKRKDPKRVKAFVEAATSALSVKSRSWSLAMLALIWWSRSRRRAAATGSILHPSYTVAGPEGIRPWPWPG